MDFQAIFVAAATVESLNEVFARIRPGGKWNVQLLLLVLTGVIIALLMPGADLYKAVNIEVWPPLAGRILTGILFSRGANALHDFLGIVEAWKGNLKGPAGAGAEVPASTVKEAV